MPADISIISNVKERFGSAQAEACKRFFDEMTLPVPMGGEYYTTTDGGYLAFLRPYGCTLRLVLDHQYAVPDHPHALQPIFQHYVEGCEGDKQLRFDINPAIHLSNMYVARHNDVVWDLFEGGITIKDAYTFNYGYLPGTDPLYPVVLDVGQIEKLTEGVWAVKKYLPDGAPADMDVQACQYGILREAAKRAWPKGQGSAVPEKVMDMWSAFAAMKSAGKLARDFSDTQLAPLVQRYEQAIIGFHPLQQWLQFHGRHSQAVPPHFPQTDHHRPA